MCCITIVKNLSKVFCISALAQGEPTNLKELLKRMFHYGVSLSLQTGLVSQFCGFDTVRDLLLTFFFVLSCIQPFVVIQIHVVV